MMRPIVKGSLKQKIRDDFEYRHNSPWNIAVDFNVNMSLTVDCIAGMLSDYLDLYGLKAGYLLTFSFNDSKEIGVKTVQFEDKNLIEAIV